MCILSKSYQGYKVKKDLVMDLSLRPIYITLKNVCTETPLGFILPRNCHLRKGAQFEIFFYIALPMLDNWPLMFLFASRAGAIYMILSYYNLYILVPKSLDFCHYLLYPMGNSDK
jgi:hypothetical protein